MVSKMTDLHICGQKERILTLEIERTQMAKDIDEIKN
jgi:hypothetical protein